MLEKLTCQSPKPDQATQRLLDGVAAPERILNNRELKVACRLVMLLLDDINLSFELVLNCNSRNNFHSTRRHYQQGLSNKREFLSVWYNRQWLRDSVRRTNLPVSETRSSYQKVVIWSHSARAYPDKSRIEVTRGLVFRTPSSMIWTVFNIYLDFFG